jgi:hypothetical protein
VFLATILLFIEFKNMFYKKTSKSWKSRKILQTPNTCTSPKLQNLNLVIIVAEGINYRHHLIRIPFLDIFTFDSITKSSKNWWHEFLKYFSTFFAFCHATCSAANVYALDFLSFPLCCCSEERTMGMVREILVNNFAMCFRSRVAKINWRRRLRT